MTTAERINKTLQHLEAPFQREVLDFVEFLLKKQSKDDEPRKEFSLSQALEGPENNEKTEYGEKMELMRSAMSDPLFLADLEEIREDFQYADFEEVIG